MWQRSSSFIVVYDWCVLLYIFSAYCRFSSFQINWISIFYKSEKKFVDFFGFFVVSILKCFCLVWLTAWCIRIFKEPFISTKSIFFIKDIFIDIQDFLYIYEYFTGWHLFILKDRAKTFLYKEMAKNYILQKLKVLKYALWSNLISKND